MTNKIVYIQINNDSGFIILYWLSKNLKIYCINTAILT